MQIAHLAKKLTKEPSTQQRLRAAIEEIDVRRTKEASIESAQTVAHRSLAELYQSHISPLGPKIILRGEPHLLQRPEIAAKIRTALLAGVRAMVLWRQMGGRVGTSRCAGDNCNAPLAPFIDHPKGDNPMQHNVLTALSPIDGRYQNKTAPLAVFGSEYALIKYRVLVEIHWLIHLARDAKLPALAGLTEDICDALSAVATQFTVEDAQTIKEIERETNHDVKAVEYFVKSRIEAMDEPDLKDSLEFVHFGCTSEDINNLAHGLMLKGALNEVLLPALTEVRDNIAMLGQSCSDIAMMARTHGQPASPTTVGKELMNVVARLDRQLEQVNEQPILGKMNGAVGNFNAHTIAYPDLDWQGISQRFVESLGLDWNAMTTQIEPHDYMAELFQNLVRLNTILVDFDRDIWSYISIGYFKQRAVEGETGSSTMPHKVNPIDFENSEGNLGIANALLSI